MNAGYVESNSPSSGIWQPLNRFLSTLIVLSVATAIAYRFLPEVSKQRDQDLRLEKLKSQLEQEKMSFLKFQREENALKHDRDYLETIARDRLDLMKEGETIYRIEAPKPDKSQMRLKK